MERIANFSRLEPYRLTEIKETGSKLGHGSYATVLQLDYLGLKCAGKKIHEALLEQGGASYTVRRFEEECHLLSQVRHPNVVQFLGVHFQEGVPAPILVMEFLPTNLTSCIEQYGILQKEISYSVLHDVSLGLCYLHSQTPPIIHRDLSSNNVLLTPNMTAKISDLGVARILKLTPLQVSRMTKTPGTPAYMPPEVMVANPKYNQSIDVFSYGILILHIFTGTWPEPQVGQTQVEDDKLVPVTEAKRREVFFQIIKSDHPLMDLILRCINNDPKRRAQSWEIVDKMTEMVLRFPTSFSNRLEMLRQIEHLQEKMRVLKKEKDTEKQKKDQLESNLRKENEEDIHVVPVHNSQSSEVEELKLKVQDLNAQNQFLIAKQEAGNTEFKTKLSVCEDQIKSYEKNMEQEKLHYKAEREKLEIQLANEKKITTELSAEISRSTTTTFTLEQNNQKLQAELSKKDATIHRYVLENLANTRLLEEKETVISGMTEQLAKAKEIMSLKKQVLQASITWTKCAKLPTRFELGSATVIEGKVYLGGGMTDSQDRTVYCYDPSQDKWASLPLLPVSRFSLGQVNNQLVAIGGWKSDKERSNEILTYVQKGKTRKWTSMLPPMPTARHSMGVLSLKSALIVAGGYDSSGSHTAKVEIFNSETSQWFETVNLPTDCRGISLAAIGNTCYALGGYKYLPLNQAFCASIDYLLQNTGSKLWLAWKAIPNTPNYEPAAAVLAGNLIVIGGRETSKGAGSVKEVYMYSPSTNSWIYISDLPEPRSDIAIAVLSPTELLVIGGRCDSGKVDSIYRGTLDFIV